MLRTIKIALVAIVVMASVPAAQADGRSGGTTLQTR